MEALKAEYPDDSARDGLERHLNTIAQAYKTDPNATVTSVFFGDMMSGLVITFIGFFLYLLGAIASTVGQYDLACRVFEEWKIAFLPIIALALRRNMWLLTG